jgi:hypothetical protein
VPLFFLIMARHPAADENAQQARCGTNDELG